MKRLFTFRADGWMTDFVINGSIEMFLIYE